MSMATMTTGVLSATLRTPVGSIFHDLATYTSIELPSGWTRVFETQPPEFAALQSTPGCSCALWTSTSVSLETSIPARTDAMPFDGVNPSTPTVASPPPAPVSGVVPASGGGASGTMDAHDATANANAAPAGAPATTGAGGSGSAGATVAGTAGGVGDALNGNFSPGAGGGGAGEIVPPSVALPIVVLTRM